MTIKALYPTIEPTLNLDFANTKRLDPRITFSRASAGTYFDENGTLRSAATNVARFDHNPTTGESLGLLVEEARTNYVQRSTGVGLFARGTAVVTGFTGTITVGETYTSSVGGQFRLIGYISSVAYFTAISGDQNLGNTPLTSASATITSIGSSQSEFNIDTYGNVDLTTESVTCPDGTSVSISTLGWKWSNTNRSAFKSSGTGAFATVYVRPRLSTTVANFYIEMGNGGDGDIGATFTLSTQVLGSFTGSGAFTATALPNGWYRFTWGRTAMTGTEPRFSILGRDSSNAGVNASMHVAFAQVEVGSFPTSYIPTTGSTVTRSADVAQITESNFTNFYQSTAGTLLAEYRTPANGTRNIAALDDNTANERLALISSGTDPKFIVTDGGTTQVDIDGGTISANTPFKTAAAFAANDFAIVHNGGAAVTDTSGTLPTVNRLRLGAGQAGDQQNGTLKKLVYWPTRLSDATLQAITR